MDDVNNFKKLSEKIIENLSKVIIGKEMVLEQALVGLLCSGHLLIEDVPGVGKTMLARGIAQTFGCEFRRIQFTPDLLPSDVTGISIFNQQTREFEFRPGPIIGQIVLADEINRATPKTQSALLEAMEERQITVDGTVHLLPKPFMVLATQNPIEYEGTFPLPEAQLDRFLLRIRLGYPTAIEEIKILEKQLYKHPIHDLQAVVTVDDLILMQEKIKEIYVSDPIKQYIVEICRTTRENEDVYLGASPRGSLGLYRTSQAIAAIRGRDFVLPDDIKYLSEYVLSHRIVINPAARLSNLTAPQVIQEILYKVPVPSVGSRQLSGKT